MANFENNYSKLVEEYMAVSQPLFEKAHRLSEFNVIKSILAVRGMTDNGWNPYENTEDVFEKFANSRVNLGVL